MGILKRFDGTDYSALKAGDSILFCLREHSVYATFSDQNGNSLNFEGKTEFIFPGINQLDGALCSQIALMVAASHGMKVKKVECASPDFVRFQLVEVSD